MGLESKLQSEILKLNCDKFYTCKIQKANEWGFPDIITFRKDGTVFFCELKQSGKKLHPRQQEFKRKLNLYNTNVYHIDNMDSFLNLVKL